MTRFKPRKISTAVCLLTTSEQRALIEAYATEKQLSLSQAGRELIDLGAKAAGLV